MLCYVRKFFTSLFGWRLTVEAAHAGGHVENNIYIFVFLIIYIYSSIFIFHFIFCDSLEFRGFAGTKLDLVCMCSWLAL